jgi:hypothetical protein
MRVAAFFDRRKYNVEKTRVPAGTGGHRVPARGIVLSSSFNPWALAAEAMYSK